MTIALYMLLFAAGVAADVWTKYLACSALSGGRHITLIQDVISFVYVENNGAAFSSFQGMRWLLITLTAAALALIIYILCNGFIIDIFGRLSVIFISIGAVGNLIDRIFRGYVVDMIKLDFLNFPIFNLADVFITIGTIMLFIYILFFQKSAGETLKDAIADTEEQE